MRSLIMLALGLLLVLAFEVHAIDVDNLDLKEYMESGGDIESLLGEMNEEQLQKLIEKMQTDPEMAGMGGMGGGEMGGMEGMDGMGNGMDKMMENFDPSQFSDEELKELSVLLPGKPSVEEIKTWDAKTLMKKVQAAEEGPDLNDPEVLKNLSPETLEQFGIDPDEVDPEMLKQLKEGKNPMEQSFDPNDLDVDEMKKHLPAGVDLDETLSQIGLKEPKAKKEWIPALACEACKKSVDQLLIQVQKKRLKSKLKLDQSEIEDLAEEICDEKLPGGQWLASVAIEEEDNKFLITMDGSKTRCATDCKTVAAACRESFGEVNLDLAALLWADVKLILPDLEQKGCYELSDVCMKPVPIPTNFQKVAPKAEISRDEL
eukprot:m.26334 g.26334  ORF g.26334 m.26334 type:complete len:374 (+) comp7784_c0_seq2:58-1179(+)